MLIWYQLKVYQQALGFGWALFAGGIMGKKTEKSEQNKKESIWRDRNSQHPKGKCSSGLTFRTEKVKGE